MVVIGLCLRIKYILVYLWLWYKTYDIRELYDIFLYLCDVDSDEKINEYVYIGWLFCIYDIFGYLCMNICILMYIVYYCFVLMVGTQKRNKTWIICIYIRVNYFCEKIISHFHLPVSVNLYYHNSGLTGTMVLWWRYMLCYIVRHSYDVNIIIMKFCYLLYCHDDYDD